MFNQASIVATYREELVSIKTLISIIGFCTFCFLRLPYTNCSSCNGQLQTGSAPVCIHERLRVLQSGLEIPTNTDYPSWHYICYPTSHSQRYTALVYASTFGDITISQPSPPIQRTSTCPEDALRSTTMAQDSLWHQRLI